jgi:ketosteroid isomerase-like protein
MTRRGMLMLITMALPWLWIALPPSNAVAQQTEGMDGVRAASKAFYEALAVIDNGEAMEKVWAHTPYVTFVGPNSKSIIVGWDAQKKYWPEANRPFLTRNVSLSEAHIHVNGNLAWEMGEEVGEAKMKNGTVIKPNWIVTNVYEKQADGRWLMVSHHVQPKPQ